MSGVGIITRNCGFPLRVEGIDTQAAGRGGLHSNVINFRYLLNSSMFLHHYAICTTEHVPPYKMVLYLNLLHFPLILQLKQLLPNENEKATISQRTTFYSTATYVSLTAFFYPSLPTLFFEFSDFTTFFYTKIAIT